MAKFRLTAWCLCMLPFCMPSNAKAETWIVESGTVIIITASFDANYALRVYVRRDGTDPLEKCTGTFAYINNVAGENFQAKAALLLNAYNQKQSITFTYTVESNGYCRLGDISLVS